MKRLDEIEARANAATEGPWEWEGEAKTEWEEGANSLVPSRRPDDPVLYGYGYDASGIEVKSPADAEFIAHARTDVPALVSVARYALSQHAPDGHGNCGPCDDATGEDGWPCSTVREIHRLLGEDA